MFLRRQLQKFQWADWQVLPVLLAYEEPVLHVLVQL